MIIFKPYWIALFKKSLCIDYFAGHSQENTKSDVEPVGVFYLDSFWHLLPFAACVMITAILG
jgi:hypothetical protein